MSVAGVDLPTLSRRKSTLLACMNLVKAIFHREPAGGYVCDVAAWLHAADAEAVAALLDEAGGQGLRNTALFGLRCAAPILGVEGPALPSALQGSAFLGGAGTASALDDPDGRGRPPRLAQAAADAVGPLRQQGRLSARAVLGGRRRGLPAPLRAAVERAPGGGQGRRPAPRLRSRANWRPSRPSR